MHLEAESPFILKKSGPSASAHDCRQMIIKSAAKMRFCNLIFPFVLKVLIEVENLYGSPFPLTIDIKLQRKKPNISVVLFIFWITKSNKQDNLMVVNII
jgi:hypothetical protein